MLDLCKVSVANPAPSICPNLIYDRHKAAVSIVDLVSFTSSLTQSLPIFPQGI